MEPDRQTPLRPPPGRVPRRRASSAPTMTTGQISDLHAALVRRLGHGIDPAVVRAAVEDAGFRWEQ